MPERTSKGGALRTDWQWKPVGRIRVSYGATRREHHEFVSCLDQLKKNARITELRAIKRGDILPAQVIEAKNRGTLLSLNLLLEVRTTLPLWETFATMVGKRGSRSTQYSYHKALRKLKRVSGLGDDAKVEDLLTLEKQELRRHYQSPVSWNHARVTLLTCCSQLFGSPDHEFRLKLRTKLGKREKEPKRPLGVTPALFWGLIDALPEHVKAPIITLAATGMRFEEYMQVDEASLRPGFAVFVSGRVKTVESEALVHVAPSLWPWIVQGIPAPLTRKSIRRQFQRAAIAVGLGQRPEGGRYSGLRIHDLRHLTAIFALEGGATVNELQSMMRHADPRQSMDYARLSDSKRGAAALGRALEREVPQDSTQRADA